MDGKKLCSITFVLLFALAVNAYAVLPVTDGLIVHLDASFISDANSVPPWEDLSGNLNHAVQTNLSLQPTLKENAVNGLSAMNCSSVTGQYLNFSYEVTGIRTVFWVLKDDSASGTGEFYLLGQTSQYGWARSGTIYGDDTTTAMWHSTFADSKVKSGATRIDGLLVDGTRTAPPTSYGVVALVTTGPMTANYLACDRGAATRAWVGDFAEVIIYDRALTLLEEAEVGHYLANKYNLPTSYPDPGTPVVIISEPATNEVLSAGDIDLMANAYDSDGTITGVEFFYRDADAPDPNIFNLIGPAAPIGAGEFAAVWASVAPGSYVLKATTIDNELKISESDDLGIVVIPVPPAPTAPILNGLVLDLDADAVTGLNDGVVWPDLSGEGNHALVSSGSPTHTPGALNGKAVVRFDGSNPDTFDLGDIGASFPSAAHLFVVATIGLDGGTDIDYDIFSTASNSSVWRWSGDDKSYSGVFRNARIEGHSVMPDTGTYIFEIKSNPAVWEMYQNGVDVSDDPAIPDFFGGDAFTLGGFDPFALSGDIAEVIAYDRILNDSERDLVGSTLQTKYNIAGDYTDPNNVALNPDPADGRKNAPIDTDLSWDAYIGEIDPNDVSFNVYFGTTSPGTFQGNQASYTFDPGVLAEDTVHYWRIDLVGGDTGEVWSFTTQKPATKALEWKLEDKFTRNLGYEQAIKADPNITVTASSQTFGPAESAINGYGIWERIHHGNDLYGTGMWLTAQTAVAETNPSPHGNAEVGAAWIAFEFDQVYSLGKMWIWNHNQPESSLLTAGQRGLRDVAIEYTTDGSTWTKLGDYTFAQATGDADYVYNTVIDFAGVDANSVVITAKTTNGNWGAEDDGSFYYGLSEVRFGIDGTIETEEITSDTFNSFNEGLVMGNTTLSTGISGNCMEFDGTYGPIESWDPNYLPFGGGDPWSVNMYLYMSATPAEGTVLGGFGNQYGGPSTFRYLTQSAGSSLWGGSTQFVTGVPFSLDRWQMITVTYDGKTTRLYKDAKLLGEEVIVYTDAQKKVKLAPPYWPGVNYAGKIDEYTIWDGSLSQSEIQALAAIVPPVGDFNSDFKVNLDDLKAFAILWLTSTPVADFNVDGIVNWEDFAEMAANWYFGMP